jgi:hypothetical protein
MATSVKQMMAEANAAVPHISPAQAKELIAKGDAVVVDVRDALEVRSTGKVAGALHIPCGVLEFQADPELPSHNKALDKAKTDRLLRVRRALGPGRQDPQDMGYTQVLNGGGFMDLAQSGVPVERS